MENTLGRNEPCHCGSGKKFKRCHGVNAAPKLTAPAAPAPGMAPPPGQMPFDVNNMDPKWMAQFSQALQRLPHGQMQRLQSIMQRAMSGKDVTNEAQEFEKTLPPHVKTLLQGFKMPGAEGAAAEGMSEDEARRIVAAAAAEGKISGEKAAEVLGPETEAKKGGFSKLWTSIKGKQAL